jgi:hypothetical protein
MHVTGATIPRVTGWNRAAGGRLDMGIPVELHGSETTLDQRQLAIVTITWRRDWGLMDIPVKAYEFQSGTGQNL